MTSYSYDNVSLFRDGKRWFPVMGEMHYSRFPFQYWKEALLKMKAGGVDIVSSYVIWIHHEEIENQWDFSGVRDLRKFVETIKECGLTMILRIGPWSHAEVRNGGFPDWLLTKCPKYRSNDESYFAEVRKFYEKIYEQVEGLLLKDGGPIIGVQIENEYGHCGGLCGEEGEVHMKRLTAMSKEVGFDVPLYTATGWGGAVTAGLLPVMGGYCDAPWDPKITELEPSGNFVFTYERNDHAIGCDFGLGEGITFDMSKVPYLTAELGGGLQVTKKRRPVAQSEDIGAMSLSKMGSGCNLLGYYMYHGGVNPEGKLTTLEENIASGSLNDLAVKNYDFRAPLGEYGFANETYKEIRRLSLFLHDFGEELCGMKTFIPEDNPVYPSDREHLRYSWRYDEKSEKGYLFVNNYQRHQKQCVMEAELKVPECVTGSNSNGNIKVKAADKDFFFLPFAKNQADYEYASVLCQCENNSFSGPVLYPLSKNEDFKTGTKNGKLYLSYEDSLNAQKLKGSDGGDILLVSEGTVYALEDGKHAVLEFWANEENCQEISFKCFPSEKRFADFGRSSGSDFAEHSFVKNLACLPEVRFEELSGSNSDTRRYKVTVPAWKTFENGCSVLSDVIVKLNYVGTGARLFKDGVLVDDHIFMGEDFPWEIGLKRFGKEELEFTLEVDALLKDQPIYLEKWPSFDDSGKCCSLKDIKAENVYSVLLDL